MKKKKIYLTHNFFHSAQSQDIQSQDIQSQDIQHISAAWFLNGRRHQIFCFRFEKKFVLLITDVVNISERLKGFKLMKLRENLRRTKNRPLTMLFFALALKIKTTLQMALYFYWIQSILKLEYNILEVIVYQCSEFAKDFNIVHNNAETYGIFQLCGFPMDIVTRFFASGFYNKIEFLAYYRCR